MRALYVRFIKDNAGVTAIEYGLIAGRGNVERLLIPQWEGGKVTTEPF